MYGEAVHGTGRQCAAGPCTELRGGFPASPRTERAEKLTAGSCTKGRWKCVAEPRTEWARKCVAGPRTEREGTFTAGACPERRGSCAAAPYTERGDTYGKAVHGTGEKSHGGAVHRT